MTSPESATKHTPAKSDNSEGESAKDRTEEHSSPAATVIHEVVRREGEAELARSGAAIFLSGLAAGLSMGFSFLAVALVQSGLPDEPYRRLIDSFGYCVGFVIVVLGKQQLFTESTLTAVLPLLVKRDRATFIALLRFWSVVLLSNVLGTAIFAGVLNIPGLFGAAQHNSLASLARAVVDEPFWPTAIKAVFSGWLIALMVWLLPSAKSARILVIILLTYIVAIGRFSHIVAGSVEAFFAVFSGEASPGQYLTGFFLPTLLGNTIGGVGLVALLNHAPLAAEVQE